jgi:carboxymethylenebutenolidase
MRSLRRALRVIGSVLLLLVLALVASVPLDAYLNRDRVAALTNASAAAIGDGPDVAMFVARPEGEGPFPAVVMIHEFWGLNESLISKAELLAAEGYVVVAPDTLRGTTTRYVPKALLHTITTPTERVIEDLDAVMEALRADPTVAASQIVVMGFCYGGGKAWSYALARPGDVAGTAVFYGDTTADAAAMAPLRGPVLGVFGAEDDLIPLADVAAFEGALATAGVPHEVRVFDGVGHAFVTSADGIAADAVQREAWTTFTDFLAEAVGR